MENVDLVQRLQALDHLYEDPPDFLLLEIGLLLLVLGDLLKEVSVVSVLHDNAKMRKAKTNAIN